MNTMLPKTVKVGFQEWEIRTDNLVANGDCGICSKTYKTITIDQEIPDQEETLLHELLHACCDFAGMEDDEKLTEEEFISRISPILYTVLTENKLWE